MKLKLKLTILLLLSGHIFFIGAYGNVAIISLILGFILLYFLSNFTLNISKDQLSLIVVLFFSTVFSVTFGFSNLKTSGTVLLRILLLSFFLEEGTKSISSTYVSIMKFLGVLSLVLYVMMNIGFTLPCIVNYGDRCTSMLSTYVFNFDGEVYLRNSGFFHEPGVFQFYLGVGLLLNSKEDRLGNIILITALLTTGSGNAYYIILLYLLSSFIHFRGGILLFSFVVLYFFSDNILIGIEEFLDRSAFSQLLLNNRLLTLFDTLDLLAPWNFLFGRGYSLVGVSFYLDNGFAALLLFHGLTGVFLALYGIYRFSFRLDSGLMVFVYLASSVFAETLILYPMSWLILIKMRK